eukprot:4893493-Amphidinium_carterae.2
MRRKHVCAGILAAADYQHPSWKPQCVVVSIRRTENTAKTQEYEQVGFLYSLGDSPPTQQAPADTHTPVIIAPTKKSTVVMALEFQRAQLSEAAVAAFENQVQPRRLLRMLQQLETTEELPCPHVPHLLDAWNFRRTAQVYSCAVRVHPAHREAILASSGEHGVFWKDIGDLRSQHNVILFPRQEVSTYEDAMNATLDLSQPHAGFILRVDGQWGVRVETQYEPQARSELARHK